jgi:hypothetical protein
VQRVHGKISQVESPDAGVASSALLLNLQERETMDSLIPGAPEEMVQEITGPPSTKLKKNVDSGRLYRGCKEHPGKRAKSSIPEPPTEPATGPPCETLPHGL